MNKNLSHNGTVIFLNEPYNKGVNFLLEKIVFENDYIDLIEEENCYFLRVKKEGYAFKNFNSILNFFPRLKVTDFATLSSAFKMVQNKPVLIGEIKPLIELMISKDLLEAKIQINMTDSEFNDADKQSILNKILKLLLDNKIVYGFDQNEILINLKPKEKIIVAKGLLPVKGDDSVVTYYELEEIKPQVFQDGKVNYYELNLINKVEKGAWLGQRIEPKAGIDGKTITGEIIPAIKGMQEELRYDKTTVIAEYDENKDITNLYALKMGAVVIEDGAIGVCNYLEIDEKVSFNTWNIDFDGFVDVKGFVDDNFSVKADDDIQILGDIGVGGIDEIESREGNIYIRGGIAGKKKAKIICSGDLYTKFAADCTIECGGTVHIGFYALNANIKAKEVVFDSQDSKIMGGTIQAKVRVRVGTIGNKYEVETKIFVEGFDRNKIKEEYDVIKDTIVQVKDKMNGLSQKLLVYNISLKSTDVDAIKSKQKLQEDYDKLKKALVSLQDKQKKCISYLKAKGEGEVVIGHSIYPKVQISIKNDSFWAREKQNLPITYYTDGIEIQSI